MGKALAVVLLVAFVIFSLFVWAKAPCGLWTFAPAGEQPTRCLVEKLHHDTPGSLSSLT